MNGSLLVFKKEFWKLSRYTKNISTLVSLFENIFTNSKWMNTIWGLTWCFLNDLYFDQLLFFDGWRHHQYRGLKTPRLPLYYIDLTGNYISTIKIVNALKLQMPSMDCKNIFVRIAHYFKILIPHQRLTKLT